MSGKRFNPRLEARAFRIWALWRKEGNGKLTLREVADQLGLTYSKVRHVVRQKGWMDRFLCSNESQYIFQDHHVYDAVDRLRGSARYNW